jgi:hypothetical protein
VYVCGTDAVGTASSDYVTIKYDTSGDRSWAAIYDGPFHYSDIAGAMALDAFGNGYVTGTARAAAGDYEMTTGKHDTGRVCVTGSSAGSGT